MKSVMGMLLVVAGPLAWALAQAPAPAPSGPAVTITLGPRQARAVPVRQGFNHTGGGNIDVAQPAPDTVVLTMTGVAVAGACPGKNSLASLTYELAQKFEVKFEKEDLKQAKLSIEGRVIGLLRSHRGGGSAQEGPARAAVTSDATEVLALALPDHAVADGENLSVNDREGPVCVPIVPGCYTLHQTWAVAAGHPRKWKPCKAASAEFAPDPALDSLWISYWEPFHGAAKKDFGFQITLKVVAP